MQELTDPTEWTSLPLQALGHLDALLRCDICKDFYTSAVITTCSHTFCSLCIRRCLAAEGRCPSCRTSEQESRLRKNVTVQELTDTFTTSRTGFLELGRDLKRRYEEPNSGESNRSHENRRNTRGSKRKRAELAEDEHDVYDEDRPARRTRRQRKAAQQNGASSSGQTADDAMVVDSDDASAPYSPTSAAEPTALVDTEPNDGLVACPICNQRMKEEVVSRHLDTSCPGFHSAPKEPMITRSSASTHVNSKSNSSKPKWDRLPQLSYSLFNEKQLRKKLHELGIPNDGPRHLLQRRHAEWLALWNANCDAKVPRSESALKKDLAAWERTQGGRAKDESMKAEVMDKDFDGKGWAQKNKEGFDELIRKARENRGKRKSKATDDETQSQQQAGPSTDAQSPQKTSDANPPRPEFNRSLTAPPSTDAVPAAALPRPDPDTSPKPPSLPKEAFLPEPSQPPRSSQQQPAGTPTRSTNKEDPPPPATLIWTKSSDGAAVPNDLPPIDTTALPVRRERTEFTPTYSSTIAVNPTTSGLRDHSRTSSLDSPSTANDAPSEATAVAGKSPIAGMAAAGAGLIRVPTGGSLSESRPASTGVGGERGTPLSRADSYVTSVDGAGESLTRSNSGGADLGRRGSVTGSVKKVPMFMLPSEPIADGDSTSTR